jgi:PilZ domain-containing protein
MRQRQAIKRARKRVEVRYGPEEPRYIGYSGNVSRTGIMVRATRVFAPGTVLHLEVKFPSGTYRVRGEVVWARAGSVQWLASGRVGMGINFIEPPEEFLNAVPRPGGAA